MWCKLIEVGRCWVVLGKFRRSRKRGNFWREVGLEGRQSLCGRLGHRTLSCRVKGAPVAFVCLVLIWWVS